MATKPATVFVHATDANFGSGPATGFPTKIVVPSPAQGFIPGTGVSAEQVNWLFNNLGTWLTDWISQGSSGKGLDAHIVETTALGQANLAALDVGGTASGTFALFLTENSGATSITALINNGSGGIAADLFANGVSPALRVTNFGSGRGVEVVSASGLAGFFDSGGTDYGVEAIGGNAGGSGVLALGVLAGNGADIFGGPTGTGALIRSFAAGGPAVAAEQDGGGIPVRGRVFIEPTAEPSGALDGDLWKRSGVAGFGRGGLEWQDNDGSPGGGAPGKQRAWSTENGLGFGYSASEPDSTEGAAILTTKTTLTIGIAFSPGDPDGEYLVEFQCAVRLGAGAAVATRAEVVMDGPAGFSDTFEIDFAALGQRKPVSTFVKSTLSGGPNVYSIKFRTLSAGNDVICSDARIVARGAYE